ncbi:hypothetical protein Plhal304r1_c054g0139221 [Plasmopara halstedii]
MTLWLKAATYKSNTPMPEAGDTRTNMLCPSKCNSPQNMQDLQSARQSGDRAKLNRPHLLQEIN